MEKIERKVRLCAGVDGGATRTRCLVTDSDCVVLGKAETGPSNPLRVGVVNAVREVAHALDRAAKEAGVRTGEIGAACFGVAGTRGVVMARSLRVELMKSLQISGVTVTTDAHIALAAALPEGFGVIALSGTGFVVYGTDAKGNSRYADGLGPLLGDEGSAYRIGLEGLMCIARELDGRGPGAAFTGPVLESLALHDLESLKNFVSMGTCDVPAIASLAPLILSACSEHDPEAQRITKTAADTIVKAIGTVADSLHPDVEELPVALCGGLLREENALREEVVRRISIDLPAAKITVPFLPPVFGALALALRGDDREGARESLLKLKEQGARKWS